VKLITAVLSTDHFAPLLFSGSVQPAVVVRGYRSKALTFGSEYLPQPENILFNIIVILASWQYLVPRDENWVSVPADLSQQLLGARRGVNSEPPRTRQQSRDKL
jgi:hypothetical protein